MPSGPQLQADIDALVADREYTITPDDILAILRDAIDAYQVVATAGADLSALRVVCADGSGGVRYASPTASDTRHVVGLTITAALTGSDVVVQYAGPVEDNSWSWTPGPVYLGASGALTQTTPTTGSWLKVAVARSATEIVVRVGEPIIRS